MLTRTSTIALGAALRLASAGGGNVAVAGGAALAGRSAFRLELRVEGPPGAPLGWFVGDGGGAIEKAPPARP